MAKEQNGNFNTRMVMVLATETRRMTEAAERVRLVVKALELSHGVHVAGEQPAGHEGIDLIE